MKFLFLTQNDEDVLLFSHQTSSMKHHLTETHKHNLEIQNVMFYSQSISVNVFILVKAFSLFAPSQNDQLQTRIQEQELLSSQQEISHKSDTSDREEFISKLHADVTVLEQKLSSTQDQVCIRIFKIITFNNHCGV